MEKLSDKIKRLRDGLDLSQDALAKRIGVSRVAVTKWENGQTENIKFANLIGLCKLFGVSLEELVCNELQGISKNGHGQNTVRQPTPEYMTEDELIVLKGFKVADKSTKKNILALAKIAIEENQKCKANKSA